MIRVQPKFAKLVPPRNTPRRNEFSLTSRISRSAPVCKLADKLLDFYGGDAFELLGDSGRVVLRNVLLQGLGRGIYQVLGFLQPKSGDFAYCLDGIDLIRAGILQNDGEFGLLFSRSRCCRAAACCRGRSNCSCCRNAKTLFELLDQSRGLEEAEAND
jgi:hypothetical protein